MKSPRPLCPSLTCRVLLDAAGFDASGGFACWQGAEFIGLGLPRGGLGCPGGQSLGGTGRLAPGVAYLRSHGGGLLGRGLLLVLGFAPAEPPNGGESDVGCGLLLDGFEVGGTVVRAPLTVRAEHDGPTFVVYLDVPLDETLKRHAGRPGQSCPAAVQPDGRPILFLTLSSRQGLASPP
ncbi:hypothetical protein [Propioniciclava soli]|uniref:hypothetical protein n=1 Tax=Propioniciclava soli TaxID=2775081 RepID=UPI001E415D5C|nr:hypothetical protein [Propioniciclava soli]